MIKSLSIPVITTSLLFFLAIAPVFASASTCPNLSRNLSFGSRGSDVVDLQTFLIAEGDLAAGNNTGYFGRMTEAAVKSWQARNGVVSSGSPSTTGYGAVGPRTRAKIASVCGGGTVSANFSASPTSGTAPLSVSFRIVPGHGMSYKIDFGDGQSGSVNYSSCPQSTLYGSNCDSTPSGFHIYNQIGTYTATLLETSNLADCNGPPCEKTVGTATITVTSALQNGASQDNPKASLRLERYNNYSAQAYFSGCKAPFSLDWGDGRAPRVYTDIPYANGSGSFVASSEYLLYMEKDGIYTATLTCGATKIQKTFIASGGGITTTNKEPRVKYFLHGNPLKVQFSFTAPSGCSSYSLSWGDGGTPFTFGGIPNGTEKADCSSMVVKSFEHTYANAGNYSIGFSTGATSQTVTANISGTEPSGPVCGAPPFRCNVPPGMACAQVMPQPRTYSDLAALRADEAQPLYAGSCEDTMISN